MGGRSRVGDNQQPGSAGVGATCVVALWQKHVFPGNREAPGWSGE